MLNSGIHEFELKIKADIVSGLYVGIAQSKVDHNGTVADKDNLLFRMNGLFFNNQKPTKKFCDSLKPNVDYKIKF